jgi:peptidoglycan DL-endopeptidase CwlO
MSAPTRPNTYGLVALPPPRRSRGPLYLGLAGIAVVFGAILAVATTMLAAVPPYDPGVDCDPGVRNVAAVTSVAGMNPEQMRNAQAIIDKGRAMGIPARGWTVAIATALQESTLRNLDHGDRDSLGLFQQRPSMGWGTPAQVRDPAYAAGKFFETLLAVAGWEKLPITVAAQRVQRSAFPAAYAKWERTAAGLVTALGQVADVSGCASRPVDAGGALDGVVAKTVAFAREQLGKPYLWGGTGPSAFDCSGLVMRAFGSAGVTLPRTSRQQFTIGAKLPREQARAGDLLFWAGNPANPATIHHVALYLGDGTILEAPEDDVPIRIRPLRPVENGLMPVVVRPTAPSAA